MATNLLSTNNNEDEQQELLNPFVHHLELTSTYEKIKTGLFTIFILPIRLAMIAGLLIVAWCFACVALVGLSEKDLIEQPLRGWRRLMREWICILGRMVYYAGGMHLSIIGKQASRKQAPILVVAPHSTFMDAVVVYVTGFPSILVRKESGMNPWLRKLINVTQPVYVRRDDPNSRQQTIQDIIDRTKSHLDWSQVLIFPEGTCTNRSCLITFKSGAFYPGVAVQPVLLRYPNKFDTVTWTWDGPGALKLLWLTLTQLHCNCEIEFLPVYVPNELEKLDPKLYAHNVRNLMAKALGVPTSEYSYEDCKLVKMARDLSLPPNSILMQTQRMRNRLGLMRKHVEEEMINENIAVVTQDRFVSMDEFADLLHVHKTDHELIHLFQLHSSDDIKLNLKKYLLCVLLATKASTKHDMILLAFKIHDDCLDKDTLQYVMKIVNCDYDKYFQQFYSSTSSLNYDTFNKILKDNEEYNEKNIDLFKKSD